MPTYHSAFEGVLATTSLMKLKDLCHHMYHNSYDGNGHQEGILTQQTQKEAWMDKFDTKL